MNNFLFISIVLIFVIALAGSFMRHRRLDRVLQELKGFQVTLVMQSDRVWGKFKLYANAIELLFSQAYVNHRGSHLSSFILFKEQMGGVERIVRFHDELTPKNQQHRLLQIELARNPGLMRRINRASRNFMVAFREAISESIGMMASRIQQTSSVAVIKSADGKLKTFGNDILDMAGNAAFDPVLEHYLFSRVVFETRDSDGKTMEYCGILEEYSANWVSILDCYITCEDEITLIDANRLMLQRSMDFEIGLRSDGNMTLFTLKIINTDDQNIKIFHIDGQDGFRFNIGKTLASGEQVELVIEDLPAANLSNVDVARLPIFLELIAPERQPAENNDVQREPLHTDYPLLPELSLVFETRRAADIYLPRSKAYLRHGSEFVD